MMLYRVAKQPDSPLGMVLFLLLGRASDGVLAGNDWYHFRRGWFVMDRKETLIRSPGYLIAPICEATDRDIQYFERSVGTPWRIWNNCLTKITMRIFMKDEHPMRRGGDGSKLDALANNALMRLASRMALVTSLGILSFIASRSLSTMDTMANDLQFLAKNFAVVSNKIEEHARRLDKVENKVFK